MHRQRRAVRSASIPIWGTLTLILAFVPAGYLLWDRLPSEMAIHFTFSGHPDDFAPKECVVIGMPLFLAAMQGMVLAAAQRMRGRLCAAAPVARWTVPAVSACVMLLLYGTALGAHPNVAMWMQLIVGVVQVIVGNVMPKCSADIRLGRYTSLLRTNDRQKIARFWGYCLVVGGALNCGCALLESSYLFIIVTVATMTLPWIYVGNVLREL